MIRERDDYIRKYKKNQPSRCSRSGDSSSEEGSLGTNGYYC